MTLEKGYAEEATMLHTPCAEPPTGEDGITRRPTSPARSLLVGVGPGGSRVNMAVSGEFCLDDSQRLRHALRNALTRSAEGVDLDLGELAFADSSVLNVLLALRGQAVAAGKTIIITAASPAVARLLTFTDTCALFSATNDGAGPATRKPRPQRKHTDSEILQTEVVQLQRAMRTRPDIDMARGILMASFGLNPDQAWEVLVTASQNTNTKLYHLAKDVVTTVQGMSMPDPAQRQLTAAVAKVRAADDHPRSSSRTGPTRRQACQECR